MSKKIYLANPRGFCAGVDRAIGIVEKALEQFGAPIYVRNEVVHNKFVVDGLRERGAIFVKELHEVPDDSIVIFSAHGVSKAVQNEAKERGLKVFDATCPLVTKVHMEVSRDARNARDTILIGHAGHPEVEGTMGQFDASFGGKINLVEDMKDAEKINIDNQENNIYVTQTTLSLDDTKEIIGKLRDRFPVISAPKKDDICYATQNRQDAVRELSQKCSLIFVVGSKNSSNSNRLRELAEKEGAVAYLIDRADDIDVSVLKDHANIGVTAGASAPEILVKEVLELLANEGAVLQENVTENPETIVFPLPKELRD